MHRADLRAAHAGGASIRWRPSSISTTGDSLPERSPQGRQRMARGGEPGGPVEEIATTALRPRFPRKGSQLTAPAPNTRIFCGRRVMSWSRAGSGSARSHGGFRHDAASACPWRALWIARGCPASTGPGRVVRRRRLRRPGLLWQRFFPVWLWECGLLRRLRTGPIRVSRGGQAGLRSQSGCPRLFRARLSCAARGPGPAQPGFPQDLAPGLVIGKGPSSPRARRRPA